MRLGEAVLVEQPDRQRIQRASQSSCTAGTELCSLIELDAEKRSLMCAYVAQFASCYRHSFRVGDLVPEQLR